jgi:hypothetical protein
MRSTRAVNTIGILVTAALALPLTSSAQTASNPPTGKTGSWSVPRTPWGDPDIQGLWPANDMQGTPYERPESFGTRATLTDEEFTARQQARERQVKSDSEVYVPAGQRTGIGGPSHWSAGERGNPQRQASLVVDPPTGRIPPMTEEGKKRIALARSTYYFDFPDAVVAHPFEKFEDLGPYDRCITRGVLSSMLPTAYNMGTEIMQIPGAVVIRNEMIHETRIIPVDGRPHISPKIRSYMGDSRGRWEGDTLVIETTHFNGKVGLTRNGNTLLTSPNLKLVERITRTDANTLQYEATVHDPDTWTQPWTVALPLTHHPEYQFFEYACHEGNYSMRNILSASRAEEKKASESGSGSTNQP